MDSKKPFRISSLKNKNKDIYKSEAEQDALDIKRKKRDLFRNTPKDESLNKGSNLDSSINKQSLDSSINKDTLKELSDITSKQYDILKDKEKSTNSDVTPNWENSSNSNSSSFKAINSNDINQNSDTMEEDAEDKLDILKYVNAIFEYKKIIFLIVFLFFLIGLYTNPVIVDVYKANAKLLVQNKSTGPNGQITPLSYFDRRSNINTLMSIIRSREVLLRVIDKLNLSFTPAFLGNMITVKKEENSNILILSVVSVNPILTAEVANTASEEFIDYYAELNRKDITDAISYIEVQLKRISVELKDRENDLKHFEEKHRDLVLRAESNIQIEKLSSFEMQLENTIIELVDVEEKMHHTGLMMKREKLYVDRSFTFDNSLEQQLITLNIELAQNLTEMSERHPSIIKIRNQIKRIKSVVAAQSNPDASSSKIKSLNEKKIALETAYNEFKIERASLISKKRALTKVITSISANMSSVPKINLEYARIKRRKSQMETVYTTFVSKLQENKIRKEMESANVVLWERSLIPQTPIPTKKSNHILIMLFVGLILGSIIAVMLDILNPAIKTPEELEKSLKLPLLGIIPQVDGVNAVLAEDSDASMIEPYRSLRTNIRYSQIEKGIKSLLIASAIQGDGKTTKSANLAISFALDGKKVMLIDADLRRSSVHKFMNLPIENGLTEYLTRQISFEEAIKDGFDGRIKVITSGKRPPNPAEVLGSSRFKDLIEEAKKMVDIVIVDSPAVIPVSDALLLANQVDATIILCRSNKTPLNAFLQVKNSLNRMGANIIGMIYNGMEQRKRYYYPYYNKYYKYYRYKTYYYHDYDEHEPEQMTFKEFAKSVGADIISPVITTKNAITKTLGIRKPIYFLAVLVMLVASFVVYKNKETKKENKFGIKYYPKTEILDNSNTKNYGKATEADKKQIEKFVNNWKSVFDVENLNSYLGFYSRTNFKYKKQKNGFALWKKTRKRQFKKEGWPKLFVDNVNIRFKKKNYATVRFMQTRVFKNEFYDTKTKILVLQKFPKIGWKITREGVIK